MIVNQTRKLLKKKIFLKRVITIILIILNILEFIIVMNWIEMEIVFGYCLTTDVTYHQDKSIKYY